MATRRRRKRLPVHAPEVEAFLAESRERPLAEGESLADRMLTNLTWIKDFEKGRQA